MAMTLRQIRYFLVLAEELHFGRAAKRLHIAQPPLSASLRQLEDALGARLLERDSKHVSLTRAGALFQRQARGIMSQLGDARDMVRRIAESASGVVRVGFTPAMLFRGLPGVLSAFQDRYPGMDVQLLEQNSANQVESLTQGRIDIGFIHSIPLPDTMASCAIAADEFMCCLPIRHPLATQDRMALDSLVDEPLVMFNRELAPHYYDHIIGLFHVAGIEPRVRHEVSHWLTIIALVAHELGVALVPGTFADLGLANVVFVPLKTRDARHESRCIWLANTPDMQRDLLIDCVRCGLGSVNFQ